MKSNKTKHKLSQSTIEKLGYYVYILSDPRTGKVFYVGKGCGNRINQHLLGALKDKTTETEKIKTIRDIQSSGFEVGMKIVRHGLTEKEAFEVESSLIDLLGIKNLTNLVKGHYSDVRGIMTVSEIEIEYEAKDAVFDDEGVMLININNKYEPNLSVDEIYQATRGYWKVGKRAKDVKIVCAVYRGIIREVFDVRKWLPSSMKGCSFFEGKVSSENIRNKYLYKSVSRYWKKGSRNPIKYI